mgnify:FL=1
MLKVNIKLYSYNGYFIREWTEEFETSEQRMQYIERMERGYWRNLLEVTCINREGNVTGWYKTTREDVMNYMDRFKK